MLTRSHRTSCAIHNSELHMGEAQTAAPLITPTGKGTDESDREQRAGEEKQTKLEQEN